VKCEVREKRQLSRSRPRHSFHSLALCLFSREPVELMAHDSSALSSYQYDSQWLKKLFDLLFSLGHAYRGRGLPRSPRRDKRYQKKKKVVNQHEIVEKHHYLLLLSPISSLYLTPTDPAITRGKPNPRISSGPRSLGQAAHKH
jgi:hypothetical protein